MNYEKCTQCGLCKTSCPVYRVLLKETVSPRGIITLLKEEVYDEIIYACTLCKECEKNCPVGIKIDLEEGRKKAVNNGLKTLANKHFMENLEKHKNPFGKVEKKD